ncbi:hypothetical protein VUR80DRAFT_8189 [Thermomyces stellatus]
MYFSVFTLLTAALAGTAISHPPTVKRGSLVAEASGFAVRVEQGVHTSQVENELFNILGGEKVLRIEKTLKNTLADRLTSLSEKGTQGAQSQAGLIQAVLEAVAMLLEGLSLDEVNAFLDEATDGALSDLEDALGIYDLLEELGLA